MKILIIDHEEAGLAFALRCLDAGHEVHLWLPPESRTGEGLVERPKDWKGSMNWADLIVPTTNSIIGDQLEPYFKSGAPIFGADKKGTKLELDRWHGQQVFEDHDIPVLPHWEFHNYEQAIELVKRTGKGYAVKPWGGEADKALSFVADSPEDMIFTLEKLRDAKVKPNFMMQEKADGIEMGVSGWFGPGGWSRHIEEDWEEKKFMNDDLGENTGEMGTTVRYTDHDSALFKRVLEPLTDYLLEIGYVGDINVNCIIDEHGIPWPLEFTCRLGWPDFNIRLPLHVGDPARWMLDLIQGRDTLEVIPEIAVGVLMAHGDFPQFDWPEDKICGFPLRGITQDNQDALMMQGIMLGRAPCSVGGRIFETDCLCTAGQIVLVSVGTGQSVYSAQQRAYDVAWAIDFPSNRKFRTDIGKRLQEQLPKLQRLGYAMGVDW